MFGIGGIVDSAAQDIEDTSVNGRGLEITKPLIKLLGLLALKVVDARDANISHIRSNPGAYTGELL